MTLHDIKPLPMTLQMVILAPITLNGRMPENNYANSFEQIHNIEAGWIALFVCFFGELD